MTERRGVAEEAPLLAFVSVSLALVVVHQLVIALGTARSEAWLDLGTSSVFLAVLVLLGGGALLALSAGEGPLAGRLGSSPLLPVTLGLAVAFVLARSLTWDPYYAPTARRYLDGGAVPLGWIVALGVGAAAAAGLARLFPRLGMLASGAALWLCGLAAILVGAGH